MTTAVLGLGGNLGDRTANLAGALTALGDAVVSVSSGYTSPPWGDPDQPEYLNACVLVDGTGRDGGDHRYWLERAGELERLAGRVRDPQRRFGPRPLDVDVVLAWDDAGLPVTSTEQRLLLPHPRAQLRAFVLIPLLELLPKAAIPGHGAAAALLGGPAVVDDLADLRRCGAFVPGATGWYWKDGVGCRWPADDTDGLAGGNSR